MKITKSYLKQIIKEEVEKMEEAGYRELEGGKAREVTIKLGGKTFHINFHEEGGSPLFSGDDLYELSDEDRMTVMSMARAAAEVRGGAEDYSPEEMDTMMSGGRVSAFKGR